MADDTGAWAFAAFRELVLDDFPLRTWLQVPLEREAYFKRLVETGAEKGFVFDAATVRDVAREGELTWLMQGCDVQ